MLNSDWADYIKTPTYYYIGHFSRFIKPGAKRIAYSKYTSDLEVTSFINTDGSIAVVILNRGKHGKHINLCLAHCETEGLSNNPKNSKLIEEEFGSELAPLLVNMVMDKVMGF